MAKRNDMSKCRPARNQTSSRTRFAPGHIIPTPVEDLIEEERERLMRAHSVLDCVLVAMDDDDSMPTHGPHYPSLIEIARDMVNESIGQLDATNLQSVAAKEDEPEMPADRDRRGYMVREAVAVSWYDKLAANSNVAPLPCGTAGAAVESAASPESPRTQALQ